MTATETPIVTMDSLETGYEPGLQRVNTRARIISISECQADHVALSRIVDANKWHFTPARTYQEGALKLRCLGAVVVFSDCTLPDGTWRDVLNVVAEFEEPPLLVVASAFADELLWSEVLNLGGYDVLQKPYVQDEVERVLDSVWRHHAHHRFHQLPATLSQAHSPA